MCELFVNFYVNFFLELFFELFLNFYMNFFWTFMWTFIWTFILFLYNLLNFFMNFYVNFFELFLNFTFHSKASIHLMHWCIYYDKFITTLYQYHFSDLVVTCSMWHPIQKWTSLRIIRIFTFLKPKTKFFDEVFDKVFWRSFWQIFLTKLLT